MTLFGGQQEGTVPAPPLLPAPSRKGAVRSTAPAAPSWVRSGGSLAPFKVTPMVQLGSTDGGGDRPYVGGCCPRCTPHSKKAHMDPQVMQLGIRNLLRVNTMDPDRSFLVRTFCFLSHAASRDIRLPPAAIQTQTVLETDAVQLALEQSVELELESRGLTESPEAEQRVRRVLYARAEAILSGMRTTISSVVLRFSTWALLHLLRCMLGSVLVHKGQVEAVRLAQQSSPGTPIVFLPLHKSHLDYILLSFVCTNYGVQAPLVAAGDNLRIPVFGWLLSRLGAFYVKRRLDSLGKKDVLYRALLQNYMVEALSQGYNMEFFIEGGRSRNGRPKSPKAGLLSVVVHALHEQRIEEALLVPVGISYDRLIDGNFIGEQLGRPKQGESLVSALRAIWAVLRARHGSVRIDFAQPFKLSEFLATARFPRPPPPADVAPLSSSPDSHASGSSLFGLDLVDWQHRSAVNALAEHVLYDAARCCAVMSTQLVALLLLHRFRSGCTLSALNNAFGKARDDLRHRGVDVGFRGDAGDVVQSAVSLLGPGLVTQERLQMGGAGTPDRPALQVTFIRPVTILPNVLELAYYANAAGHPLSLDAVLVSALLSLLSVDLAALVDAGPCADCEVGRHQLLAAAADLADLLRDELLLAPPCCPLDDALIEPLNRLTSAEVLTTVQPKLVDESEEWASRAFTRFRDQVEQADSDSDGDGDGDRLQADTFWMVQLTSDSLEHVLTLQSLVAPVVDTYYMTACCLHRLVAQELAEQDFVLDVLYEVKNKLMLGLLAYGESLSAESIRSALRTFRRWGVLESYEQDGLRLLYLSREYDTEQAVAQLVARILPFKK